MRKPPQSSRASLIYTGLRSIDRPTGCYGVGPGSGETPRLPLDEFGDELGGAGRAVGLNVAVADGLADQFSNVGRDEAGVGGGVVHVLAGAVAVEPVADVEVLLEVVPEREVEERALSGGQLHGGG